MDEQQIREIIRDELSWILKEDKMVLSYLLQILDGKNVQLGITTGTKLGTATTQKLGFWNTTPIVQPSGANQVVLNAYVAGTKGLDTDANMQALYNLVVAMRLALVNAGLIKGSA